MATIFKEEIHKKYKQLNNEDRLSLERCLQRGMNLTDISKYLNCSISTVKKEIDRNKVLKIASRYKNTCGLKKICIKYQVCGNFKCTHACKDCKLSMVNCNDYCNDYTNIPHCKNFKHLCGVCNGCNQFSECKLNKYIYTASDAQKNHKMNLIDSHKGARITSEEAKELTEFLKPLILRNLSLEVIKSQYPNKFKYSVQTIYNWIDKKILDLDNIMLVRKVKYSKRKSSNKDEPIYSRVYLEGRYYDDFLTYITEHPMDEVVEMDTIEGSHHASFIMTLLFRRCNFMLAFKIQDQSSQSIIDVFDEIKTYLGNETFKQYFSVILTDRGKEFTKPLEIEVDNTMGEKLISVFYCDSRQSQQKGKIEKNHEELRKIFPKGFDFNSINQDQLNLALAHVNSYPRKMFGYKTPHDLFKAYACEALLDLNNSKKISFKDLNLSPSLIK